MSASSIHHYTPRICYNGNHAWKQVTPEKIVKIDKERVLLINYVCQDCFAISQYRENVR